MMNIDLSQLKKFFENRNYMYAPIIIISVIISIFYIFNKEDMLEFLKGFLLCEERKLFYIYLCWLSSIIIQVSKEHNAVKILHSKPSDLESTLFLFLLIIHILMFFSIFYGKVCIFLVLYAISSSIDAVMWSEFYKGLRKRVKKSKLRANRMHISIIKSVKNYGKYPLKTMISLRILVIILSGVFLYFYNREDLSFYISISYAFINEAVILRYRCYIFSNERFRAEID